MARTKLDPNSLAPNNLTYKLYMANKKASQINGCHVYGDWHKQELTVQECKDKIEEYNEVINRVTVIV